MKCSIGDTAGSAVDEIIASRARSPVFHVSNVRFPFVNGTLPSRKKI